MDKREALLRSIEDEETKLVSFAFDSQYRETWRFAFEVNQIEYSFSMKIYEKEKITIFCSPYLKSNSRLEERLSVSTIVHKLINALKNFPSYRLLFLLNQYEIHFDEDKYLILDVKNFENRKTNDFVEKHKVEIAQIFKECLSSAKSNARHSNERFLVQKEVDEIPLFHFLEKEGHIRKIASFNAEEYYKVNILFPIEEYTFYDLLHKKMRTLGYNLFSSVYVGDESYDYDDSYHDWSYFDDEEYENFYK